MAYDQALAKQNNRKNWSIMVYLAGGKDVSEEARESMLRMKQVGTTDRINIIAQFDSGSDGTSTKRYLLSRLDDALSIDSLLTLACEEVAVADNSTAGKFYCQLLREIILSQDLSYDQQECLESKMKMDELVELLWYSPDQFKRRILDCSLHRDITDDQGNLGFTNAGDPKVLVEFVRWAKGKFEADHYMVIFWGHGSGLSVAWDYPASPFLDQKDSLVLNELEQELGKIAGEFPDKKVDIVGFNSCSLGTVEVYHQLRNLVKLGIASEGYTPKTSWPYDKILKDLDEGIEAEGNVDPEKFGDIILDNYVSYYSGSVKITDELQRIERKMKSLGANLDMNNVWGLRKPRMELIKPRMELIKPRMELIKPRMELIKPRMELASQEESKRGGIDLSVCDLEQSSQVASAMQSLVSLLIKEMDILIRNKASKRRMNHARSVFSAILGAHAVGQSYFNADFTDLFDFCRALKHFCSNDRSIQKGCEDVMDAIETKRTRNGRVETRGMCLRSKHVGDEVQNTNGVSIFFPWSEWGEDDVIARYEKLSFIQDHNPKKPGGTGWKKFLQKYRRLASNFERKRGVFK